MFFSPSGNLGAKDGFVLIFQHEKTHTANLQLLLKVTDTTELTIVRPCVNCHHMLVS